MKCIFCGERETVAGNCAARCRVCLRAAIASA